MSESKSPEETKMDKSSEVLCETFAALQARELKLKEHLAIALKSQKLANEQYEKEREAREAIEKMFRELSEKLEFGGNFVIPEFLVLKLSILGKFQANFPLPMRQSQRRKLV